MHDSTQFDMNIYNVKLQNLNIKNNVLKQDTKLNSMKHKKIIKNKPGL